MQDSVHGQANKGGKSSLKRKKDKAARGLDYFSLEKETQREQTLLSGTISVGPNAFPLERLGTIPVRPLASSPLLHACVSAK